MSKAKCQYAISYRDLQEMMEERGLKIFHTTPYCWVLLPKTCRFKQKKYLNNIIEQSHRFIKKLIKNNQWFQSFKTVKRTIAGFEIMNMIRRGQVRFVAKGDVFTQKTFVENLFGIGV